MLGDEDLALTALLEKPDLAEAVRVAAEVEGITGFTEYESEDGRPLSFDDAEREALEATFGASLAELDRTRLCKVHVTREPGKVSLEIVHARRPKTFDKVDVSTLAVDATTDVHTERAFAELDLATGALAIHAQVGVKRLVCEALGIVLASSSRYFRPASSYDLGALVHPMALLSVEGVLRLERVELHDVAVRTAKGTIVAINRPRADHHPHDDGRRNRDLALQLGKPVAMKVYLSIRGRERPLKVEITAKDGKNRVDFDRQDPEVVEIVRAYLRARGILRDTAPAMAASG